MDGDRRRQSAPSAAATTLRHELRGLAEVMAPDEAEEPILGGATRAAMVEWLAEIRAADNLVEVGLKPRSTALLFGPPGCGKTTLAHHIAARLGYPMALVGAETLFKPYLGESEQAMDRLFRAMDRTEVPCMLFLDEVEAIGGKRDQNLRGGADNARTAMLTVLLRRIERFKGMLVAATNRPQDLDPALWRRFGLQVEVGLPGDDERFAILRRYGLPFQFSDDDLDILTALTSGASPALLRGVMEGIKRALVLGPLMRRNAGSALSVIGRVVASVSPPPEIQGVPLWSGTIDDVAGMAWPPVRGEG